MKKTILHIEKIDRRKMHLHFQIKLPSNAVQVTGVLITAIPKNIEQQPPDPPSPVNIIEIEGLTTLVGQLLLSLPEKRDAFYEDEFRFPNHIKKTMPPIKQTGFESTVMGRQTGDKDTFFKITAAVKNTIVEGFYKDKLNSRVPDYTIRIYLELELKEN